MASPKRRFRFRPQFSLRTLFVLVTIFGVWLGWQLHLIKSRKDCLRSIEASGDQWILADELPPTEPSPRIFWGRRLMGDRAVYQILVRSSGLADDQQEIEQKLKAIRSIFPEAEVIESTPGLSAF